MIDTYGDLSRIIERKIPPLSIMAKTFNLHRKKKMLVFYSRLINRGDLCFDVGAYVGDFTEVFLELGAKVVCCEPLKNCVHQLYERFGNNKNVFIVPKAIGEHEGLGEFLISEETPTMSTLSIEYKNRLELSGYKWTKTQTVPITTLDNLILSYGLPKYCKIDVEGFEVRVLRGLSKPIRFVSFEFSKWRFEDAKECVNRLSQLGNVQFNFMLDESMKFSLKKWVSPQELYRKITETSYTLDDKFFWGDIYGRFV